jgi:hypothetical protein
VAEVNFLLTKCRVCGTRVKGKHYRLLLYSTPFVLLFYVGLIAVVVELIVSNSSQGATYAFAAVITFLVFLFPGILLLVYLKGPKYICAPCKTQEDFANWKMDTERAKDATLGPGATEREKIQARLADNPKARDIVFRFSQKTNSQPPLFFVDSVIAAANLERAGDYDKAISSYEALGLYDEAGRIREMKNTTRSVTVDVNELINQLRYGGLALNYKCPSCGAGLTIDAKSDASGLKYCGYCGTAIELETLNSLLRTAIR